MTIAALSAAHALCELRDWKLSNLELQKILYIAHMFHLGEYQAPLIRENFEAWDFGPVVPEVYRQVKGFGSAPIRNVFHWVPKLNRSTTEFAAIRDAATATEGMTAGRLVSITHWPKGAWYEVYRPNTIGVVIPNSLIADEFARRRKT